MGWKCENQGCGTEMLKSAKFCSGCGSTRPDTDTITCGNGECGTQMLKSAKFCHSCGTASSPDIEGALDGALEELEEFTKSRQAELLGDLAELPEVEDDPSRARRAEEFVKSAIVREDGGEDGIDAVPVVTELLKSVAMIGVQNHAYAQHGLARSQAIAEGLGLLLKSVATIGRAQRQILGELAVLGSKGAGRITRQVVTVGGATAAATGAADAGELAGMPLRDVLVKSVMPDHPLRRELSDTDVGVLEHYANGGGTLGTLLKSAHADLGARIKHALEAAA